MTDFTTKVAPLLSLDETILARKLMIHRSRQIEENFGKLLRPIKFGSAKLYFTVRNNFVLKAEYRSIAIS